MIDWSDEALRSLISKIPDLDCGYTCPFAILKVCYHCAPSAASGTYSNFDIALMLNFWAYHNLRPDFAHYRSIFHTLLVIQLIVDMSSVVFSVLLQTGEMDRLSLPHISSCLLSLNTPIALKTENCSGMPWFVWRGLEIGVKWTPRLAHRLSSLWSNS